MLGQREAPISGTVVRKRLESVTARARLKRGRQAHWQALEEGKVHLGWQCRKGNPAGRWLLRRYIGNGKYRVEALGAADDAAAADGQCVLSFEQAKAKASEKVAVSASKPLGPLTVRDAWTRYIAAKHDTGAATVDNLESRGRVHILPALGDLVVDELTMEQLRRWHATMAAAPAQVRPKAGKPQYRKPAASDEEIRARRSTANRILTTLKAALNHAFDEGLVKNNNAWGRRLKPFLNVDVARIRYLTVDEAQRLINASEPEFRPLVQAALETGCRYSELARLVVHDFNMDAGTVTIAKSKSGKPRHVILTPEGADFFRRHCAGRSGSDVMFSHANGSRWQKSEQARPMREACEHAKIKPRISFHGLRHTWASLAVMNNMPLVVVAKNLGHVDTRMVEKHYGHMAPSYITEAIHAAAPRFGVTAPTSVVPISGRLTKRKK
jgi:integrase